ncbi:hypothetical protein ACHMW6_24050 [Pseudoduganella sp. UC29_106]|uniref:hypothetical protein n=1 Tax=Pseudoduganella sp. UC29_106 TaxID=3374553 RepID=UPI003757742F
MKRKPRIYYTDDQKALMWERWRQGESLQHIAQLFGRSHGAIQGILIRNPVGQVKFLHLWPGQIPPGRTVRIVVHVPAAGLVSPA